MLPHPRRAARPSCGWPLIDEMVAILYYHPQVYVDFAGLQSLIPRAAFYEAFRSVVEAGYADRIMFGSDGTDSGVDWLTKGIDAVIEAASALTHSAVTFSTITQPVSFDWTGPHSVAERLTPAGTLNRAPGAVPGANHPQRRPTPASGPRG